MGWSLHLHLQTCILKDKLKKIAAEKKEFKLESYPNMLAGGTEALELHKYQDCMIGHLSSFKVKSNEKLENKHIQFIDIKEKVRGAG